MDADRQQAKMKEFMSLLPLTIEMAGLAHAEPGRFFTESQLEARATAIKNAHRAARQIVLDIAKPAEVAE
ncbi:MAG: hypothetical protein EXS09_12750 [Gemmataceae bacterium]|nr:hypothetical protein [Gemmataceae bacterium]